jgi:uncharacterized membrane protein YciS (DUF1049 family)
MFLSVLLRPFNAASYALSQKMNMIFGVGLVIMLVIAALAWVIDRWRTRHDRRDKRDHAALYRVRERRRRNSGR